MNGKKNVLIVTDGVEKVNKIAEDIAATLKGNKVLIKDVSAFVGTDLLGADVLFFGCEEPPSSNFGYFEEILQHINLAGRTLGVFSLNSIKAVQYLARMAKDSEAALNPKPFFATKPIDLGKWTAMVLTGQY